jgi:ammonia channel protein AmtB
MNPPRVSLPQRMVKQTHVIVLKEWFTRVYMPKAFWIWNHPVEWHWHRINDL